jgi:hypothetical protein
VIWARLSLLHGRHSFSCRLSCDEFGFGDVDPAY